MGTPPPTVHPNVGQDGAPYVSLVRDGDDVAAMAGRLLDYFAANPHGTLNVVMGTSDASLRNRDEYRAKALVFLSAWLTDNTTLELPVDDAEELADAILGATVKAVALTPDGSDL